MSDVIRFVRQYGQATYTDEFSGVTYWDDDQIEEIADTAGLRRSVLLKPVTRDYKNYRILLPKGQKLENSFKIYKSDGTELTSPVGTYNFVLNEISFPTALSSTELYAVDALVVDMWEALADLWQQKADQRFDYIDWKAQNNKMNMKQEYDHCVERALFYSSKKIRSFSRSGKGKWYTA